MDATQRPCDADDWAKTCYFCHIRDGKCWRQRVGDSPATDATLYRPLAPRADGFIPRVLRVYDYACRSLRRTVPVELIREHSKVPGFFLVRPLFLDDAACQGDGWVSAADLVGRVE